MPSYSLVVTDLWCYEVKELLIINPDQLFSRAVNIAKDNNELDRSVRHATQICRNCLHFKLDTRNNKDIFLTQETEVSDPEVLRHKTSFLLEVPAVLAHLITEAVLSSPQFSSSFFLYVTQVNLTPSSKHVKIHRSKCAVVPPVIIILKIHSRSKEFLDYKWCYRVSHLVATRSMLDDAMNWLNTLGGGYSALGDHFSHHAENAGNIALKQWKVANELGDPLILIRCHLYYALSLMQRGYLSHAKHIIRTSYGNARSLPVKDTRLVAMCKGIWSKLQYYYHHCHKTRHL